jgi:Zn-dependent peptidase ImmA (M78 family)
MKEALVNSLLAGDRTRGLPGPHLSREFLSTTAAFAARYAKLEKLLFGSVRVSYSPTALDLDLSLDGDPIAQGEALADAERARFELGHGPILELGWLIEDQGIKILPRQFPVGTAARGGFFFDESIGPCILIDANATAVQRDYMIAHQYGHFLADYDPYIRTICGNPHPDVPADASELRAHAFALAFSMPRQDLETYRKALGITPGAAITAEFVRQLQVYFAVDYEMVFWRLLVLGWIDAAGVASLLRSAPDLREPVSVDRMDADERLAFVGSIPERYVHLVASAFGRDRIELEDAAEYLEIDVGEARRVLEQFHYEDPATATKPRGPAASTRPFRQPDPN